jgi:glycosyltransferase involved in cell wall biosynthesis
VIIPCYQQANYLPEAVESVLEQTFQNFEIIIVNDGSPDHTSGVAKQLIDAYPNRRIRLIEKDNGGLASARNFGIERAKGDYIIPLDADDKLHPEMLASAVWHLDNHRNISIVYTDALYFGRNEKYVNAGEFDLRTLCRENQLSYCCLYRRDVWKAVGGYSTNMVHGYEDWDFWIGCAEQGCNAYKIPQSLFLYRVKEESMFTKAKAHDQELRAQIVLNHRKSYSSAEVKRAEQIIERTEYTQRENQKSPMVSVIVPTYKRVDLLRRTLKSLSEQSYSRFEVIVVNDAGPDVQEVVNSFKQMMEIKYLCHPFNRGLAAARNTGIKAAKGKYIAYLDDDDIYYPNHLETLIQFLENSDFKIAYTDAYRAWEVLRGGRYVVTKRDISHSHDFDYEYILKGNFIPVLCVMHAKECIDKVGGFDESLRSHEDWDLWMRMSRVYEFAHIQKATCEFSWRQDGTTMTLREKETMDLTRKVVAARGKAIEVQQPPSGHIGVIPAAS